MTPRLQRILAPAGAILALLLVTVWLPRHIGRPEPEDIWVYHQAAQHIRDGAPLYGCDRKALTDGPVCFFYPPTFAMMLRPAAGLSPAAFQHLWYVLILGATVAFALGLVRLSGQQLTYRTAFTMGAFVALTPGAMMSASLGNVDMIVWALMVWAVATSVPVLSVLLLAVGAAIKLYPVFPLVVVAWRAQRIDGATSRAAASGWVALAGLMCVVSVVLLTPAATKDWVLIGIPSTLGVMSFSIYDNINVSLSMMLLRPFVDPRAGSFPHAAAVFLKVAPLVIIAVTTLLTRKWSTRAQLTAVLVAAVFSSPICWWYQLPILLIPLVLKMRQQQEAAPCVQE